MSENRKWSIRKKFERGEYMINTERFMGYDKNEFGELVINPKEAMAVRFFANMYLWEWVPAAWGSWQIFWESRL